MDVVLPELIERTKDSIRSFELGPSTISQYQTAWKTLAGYFLEYNQALFSRPLAQAGIPLSHLKEFLGHASINTTDTYAVADPSMLRAVLGKIEKRETGPSSAAAPRGPDNEAMILELGGRPRQLIDRRILFRSLLLDLPINRPFQEGFSLIRDLQNLGITCMIPNSESYKRRATADPKGMPVARAGNTRHAGPAEIVEARSTARPSAVRQAHCSRRH